MPCKKGKKRKSFITSHGQADFQLLEQRPEEIVMKSEFFIRQAGE